MSPSAILLVRADTTLCVNSSTVLWILSSCSLSLSLLFLIFVCAKKAFFIASDILSDLNELIEPSLLTTLRLNRFTLFSFSFFCDTCGLSAIYILSIFKILLSKNTICSVAVFRQYNIWSISQ